MSEKDGGSAFPQVMSEWGDSSGGMSLRDYFAAQVMAGIDIIAVQDRRTGSGVGPIGHDVAEGIAVSCYMLADAMFAAREKR